MSDLSPEERAFIEAVREDWGPGSGRTPAPPAASAMQKRLADKPWLGLPPESLASKDTPTGFGRLFGATAATIGVCAIALVSVVTLQRSKHAAAPALASELSLEPPPTAPVPEPPAPYVLPSVAIEALPDVPPTVRAAANPSRDGKKAGDRRPGGDAPEIAARDLLGEEIALIRAAQGELRAGTPERALASLSVHASRFPGGVLRDERMTLQVLALCDRGDVDAARAVKAELERSSPSSSHLQRLASSCAR